MRSRNQGLKLYTSIIAIVLVAVSTAQLSSVVLSNNNVVYAYSNSQAQSLSNDCDVIDSSSVSNCQNSGPQTQADGTASSPITFQISNFCQQGTEERTEPPIEPQPETCEKCIRNVLKDEEQAELMVLFNRLPIPGGPGGGGGPLSSRPLGQGRPSSARHLSQRGRSPRRPPPPRG